MLLMTSIGEIDVSFLLQVRSAADSVSLQLSQSIAVG